MLKDIIQVSVIPPYKLRIQSEDGVSGEIDVAKTTNFVGVFAALCDEEVFAQVAVNTALGTIAWPNGADLDPDVLYASVVGRSNLAAA